MNSRLSYSILPRYTHLVSISRQKEHHGRTLSPELTLLGFLMEEPSHGYDLHQRFTTDLGSIWQLSQSQAYAILNRLKSRGDITTRRVEQDKLPARQLLRITPQGRRRFMDWLEGGFGSNARAIRLEFLTRLYFSKLLSPEQTRRVYAAQSTAVANSIEHLKMMLAHLPPGQPYNRLSLDLRLRQMKLIQEWMEEMRTRFHLPARETP